MRECNVPNCGMAVNARGYCKKHYTRLLRHGDVNKVINEHRPGLEVRREAFFKLVSKSDSCWIWNGPLNNMGYGLFANQKAHRVSWQLAFGPIVKGLCVLHRCDVPKCVNPQHLFIGTQQDNVTDMMKKGRNYWTKKNACRRGHLYEVHGYIDSNGVRACRICRNATLQRFRERKQNYVLKL